MIKDVFVAEFGKMIMRGVITAEEAELPDLGEIPEADAIPEEEEEEEEEEDEEDEEDNSDGDGRHRKRRGGRPKRDTKEDSQKPQEPEVRRRRGRPPRVDTPMEARIKAVLKGIRRFKDASGQMKVHHFERLPDKTVYPDYYTEIKEPIAIDAIKRKAKRKKYGTVDQFVKDLDLMFNNAKAYNQPHSQIYRDAVDMQVEARKLAEKEKQKPDSEFLTDDGRLPLPNGILYKEEVYRVGDWVHIQNPNDATKPIVAQIYRTWQDSEGDKWVNACWYYRPEQTVHQYEKHFLPNEVVKTGQYRDHRIEEVVDRCFVMFITRYHRGRPRGLPADKEVYVCEARYNEERHRFNKIKTWASCIPDEVRDKDYEMDLFPIPHKIKKLPSPIKHLLREDAKETDDLPKATWGVPNAPPVVGAVHRRPREENESPPPEPTPPPPSPKAALTPAPVIPPPAALPKGPLPGVDHHRQVDTPMTSAVTPPVARTATIPPVAPTRSPAFGHQVSYQPYGNMQRRSGGYVAPLPMGPYQAVTATPPYAAAAAAGYPSAARIPRTEMPSSGTSSSGYNPTSVYNPHGSRPIEVFHLTDNANASLPASVREHFQHDSQGHVLFFSTPPLNIVRQEGRGLSHSAKYMEARQDRRRRVEERKRKKRDEQGRVEENAKRARHDEEVSVASRLGGLAGRAVEALTRGILDGTDELVHI